MFSNTSRVVALTATLFVAGLGTALASNFQNVSVHGAQPGGSALTSASAHGMMASAKHNFMATHKLSSKKSGAHGMAGGKPNGKG
jgi:hypothetical protein